MVIVLLLTVGALSSRVFADTVEYGRTFPDSSNALTENVYCVLGVSLVKV